MSRNEEIFNMYMKLGMSMQDIGNIFGVSRQAIQQNLKKQGVEGFPYHRKKQLLLKEKREEILRLADSNLSIQEISRILGISKPIVRETFRKNGITKNSISRTAQAKYSVIVKTLQNSDMTYSEVANMFGISLSTVNRAAKKHSYSRGYDGRKGMFNENS